MEFERGSFLFVLKNIGEEPATKVITKIGGEIIGPDGKTVINDLNIFRGIEFFPPGKEFRIFIGPSSTYFSMKQPTQFTAVVTYSDQYRNSYGETINHDLKIYKDLPHPTDS